ncbi:MAG: SH3 domain-containing protein [Planctomycetota bacterium]|nr:SH3 domain-containing protein [Planctomycetota bacterium]
MQNLRWVLLFLPLAFQNCIDPNIVEGSDAFPFTAIVLRDNTPVRSGPSHENYATDNLHHGQRVEVYRHDAGDWYAIRPPRGSFSWVPAECVQIGDDNLAEVMVEGATARVGSRISDRFDQQQVHLRRGEFLQVLGERKFIDPQNGQPQTMFKVAPPSGEFRWIFGPDVADSPARNRASSSHFQDQDTVQLQDYQSPAPPADHTGLVAGAPRVSTLELSDQRMDLALSLIVSGPVADWDFDALKKRSNQQLEQAQTALERGQARLVVDEIARFEQLQQNYLALTAKTPAVKPPQGNSLPLAISRNNPLEKIPDFSGVGRLTPVVSRRSGAPKFALTDVKGNVLMFVSPGLGVDLQSHVGKVVGVSGSQGYMPRLKKNHVNVSQVERLAPTALLATLPGERTSRR